MRGAIPVSDRAADLIGRPEVPFTMVSDVPVGSLVAVLSDWEPNLIGEIDEEDHENPGFQAQGVKWIGLPGKEPGRAYVATPEFAELLNEEVLGRSWNLSVLAAGDLAAMTWYYPDPDWYINFLEPAEGMEGQPTLGFPTDPDSYGTLDMAQGVLLLTRGRKEWLPSRRKKRRKR